MPTYEYRCKDCGTTIEVVQSFTDPSLTECRECGGPLRKVFGNVGITFKGSGFYKTDSRSGNGAATKESSDKGDKGDKASDSGKDKGAGKSDSKAGDGGGSSKSDAGSGSGSKAGSSARSSSD